MQIQLIVGLANPGKEYALTRHNAGAWWVQALCDQLSCSLSVDAKLQARVSAVNVGAYKARVAIPTTFMNHSGIAVAKIANYYGIPVEQILIVHDELDFAPGVVKFKQGGGHGGHNGLRDVIAHLGNKFARLRIGIGHPGDRDLVSDYVLSNPNSADKQLIETAISDSITCINDIITGNMAAVMNKLN